MEIYDFTKIKVDPKTSLFDFTQLTHQNDNRPTLRPYMVQQGEEMRIDLVCKSIYNNMDNIDVILYCNHIDNPLNILEGAIIFYPDQKDVAKFRYEEQQESTTQKLLNPSKTTRRDPSRESFVEQNYSIPPTVLPSYTPQVKIDGNNLVIGAGLF